MNLFNSVSIKHKIRGSFFMIISLSAMGGLISFFLLNKVAEYQQTKHHVSRMAFLLAQSRKAEKDFMSHGFKSPAFQNERKSEFLQAFESSTNEIKDILKVLRNDQRVNELNLEKDLSFISSSIQHYVYIFKNLVDMTHERGFKDHGLEGEMRNYVHQLQECVSPEEKVFAFSLRRHEKDFMIRKDNRYCGLLYETASEFQSFVRLSSLPHMSEEYKKGIIEAIEDYKKHFRKIEHLENEMGLNEDEGIRGRLNRKAEEVEPKVEHIYDLINASSASLYKKSKWILISSLITMLAAGSVFSFYLTQSISRPVILLDNAVKNMLSSNVHDIEKELMINGRNDEIGSLVNNFKKMVLTVQEQWKSIRDKNDKLEIILAEEEKRKWATEGFNYFNDLIKSGSKNQKEFFKVVNSELVKYTKSNQGCIFLLDNDKYVMKKISSYAYARDKKSGLEIELGEGLIGQAWREADTVYLSDIPENYIKITSGLSKANPNALLIVPIKFDGSVLGIIELASFNKYEAYEISFVEQLSEKIGGTFTHLQLRESNSNFYKVQ